jgi:hypothetical protein
MCNIRYQGKLARSNCIPSTIMGMMPLQESGVVNLVPGASAEFSGKSSGGQNIETMTFGVDIIVLGRDCEMTSSGNHGRSRSAAEKNHDSSHVKRY